MHRVATFWCLLLASLSASSQSVSTSPSPTASDPVAVSLAQKSALALTGGAAVADITLNVNATSIFGSDNESGTGVLRAKGMSESRVDLNLSGGTRVEARSLVGGTPSGSWQTNGGTPTAYAQSNCWTDAAWFFPALTSLANAGSSNVVLKYVGQELHGGVNTQHIQVLQGASGVAAIQRMSTTDIYLDPASFLPLAVAFQVHPDLDAGTNIPAEIRFANYQSVNGIQVPYHIQRMLNGGVTLDLTITGVVFNTGLLDSTFILQ